MELKKHYGVNKDHAENGKWFDLEDGGSVLVARLGNRRFKAEVQRLQKERSAALRVDRGEALDDITTRAMGKAILLDWKNISIDGVLVEYSSENAYTLMTEYPDFREAISVISTDRNSYSLDDIAEK